MKIRKDLLILVCLLCICLAGCSLPFGRSYREDVHIRLKGREGELVVKEWDLLFDSGAEIYYNGGGHDMFLLGQTYAHDKYPHPFEKGYYKLELNEDRLSIFWCPNIADRNDTEKWEHIDVTLPADKDPHADLLLWGGIAAAAVMIIAAGVFLGVRSHKKKA